MYNFSDSDHKIHHWHYSYYNLEILLVKIQSLYNMGSSIRRNLDSTCFDYKILNFDWEHINLSW
jgi:hypothetical protein